MTQNINDMYPTKKEAYRKSFCLFCCCRWWSHGAIWIKIILLTANQSLWCDTNDDDNDFYAKPKKIDSICSYLSFAQFHFHFHSMKIYHHYHQIFKRLEEEEKGNVCKHTLCIHWKKIETNIAEEIVFGVFLSFVFIGLVSIKLNQRNWKEKFTKKIQIQIQIEIRKTEK